LAHTIVSEHPLIAVSRWNDKNNVKESLGRGKATVVLHWYAPLSESEEMELLNAEIDLDAADVFACSTD
jgi:cell division inhibitor SulA